MLHKNLFINLYLGFKFAFSYFSVLPMNFSNSDDLSSKGVLASMLLFFPLVGAVLGSLSIGLFLVLEGLSWYGAVASALFYMMLYGFLHAEAVIDVADAIYASHSGKDAYQVIKDPTIGAMGMLWAMGFVLLKVSGIVFLFMHSAFYEFISVLIVSRLTLLALFYSQTFKSSFVTQLKEAFTRTYLLVSFMLFTLLGLVLIELHFIALLLMGLILAFGIVKFLNAKLGFINGDVLGTVLEGVEIALMLMVALLWI